MKRKLEEEMESYLSRWHECIYITKFVYGLSLVPFYLQER